MAVQFARRMNIETTIRIGTVMFACLATAGLGGCVEQIDEAVQRGEVGNVKTMLDADPQLVSSRGHHDATPLHLAALSDQREVAELLLKRGAQVDARDRSGWTPLDCAAAQGHGDVAAMAMSPPC